MPGGTTPAYRLVYSGSVRGTLVSLGVQAKHLRVVAEFVADLEALESRLCTDPLGVGEPAHTFHELRLHVRLVGAPFFYLRFAVDEKRRIVYVIDCVASARLG